MVLDAARNTERGSVLIMLFIAVALFGLLAFAFLQGSRNNLSMMTSEAQKAQATQVQDCANGVDMAERRLQAKGCGALVSHNTDGSNTTPGAPSDGSCSVYHANGGGLKPCTAVAVSAPADCSGLGDSFYNDPTSGHCYFRTSSAVSDWNDGSITCAADGAYLAVITSSAEQSAVENVLMNVIMYFGIDDIAVESTWRYSFGEVTGIQFWSGNGSGSVVGGNYSNWRGGEPDQFSAGEDCGMIGYLGNPEWVDYPCTTPPWSTRALCEINGTP
jgi:hypothetical protein